MIVIYDFPTGTSLEERKGILKALQSACASGGSVKADRIELQGEHLDVVRNHLESMRFRVVQRGG